jgi:hypothetical protein
MDYTRFPVKNQIIAPFRSKILFFVTVNSSIGIFLFYRNKTLSREHKKGLLQFVACNSPKTHVIQSLFIPW